ncbi:MAG: hypothetical protein CO096_23420 [Armatimonadetes bacterium CG_4_9_14_3_um_filter_66_14]|nr:MAG: hypothetical protein CO096_23420 [Armatimonadetes bacterium CG_4_9_14_3_um_filter_66_14]
MIEVSHRTDWFHDAKWGVMCHYLASQAGDGIDGTSVTAEEWNRRVDRFDVERFANRLQQTGAGYLLMTVGQNTGHYCAPNATYDSITGIEPSKCSRRDLIIDLYDALAPREIHLLTYAPSGAPISDPVAIERFGWVRPYPGPSGWEGLCGRQAEFQRKWEAVIREWAERWGPRVRGWWIDGCYELDAMYLHPEPPNFASFAAALRAGNPERILGFNPGPPRLPLRTVDREEDYLAGHSMGLGSLYASPGTRWVEHAQFHVLEFLGDAWSVGEPRVPDAFMAEYVRYITDRDGVITLEVPITADGNIPNPFHLQLDVVGQRVNR